MNFQIIRKKKERKYLMKENVQYNNYYIIV